VIATGRGEVRVRLEGIGKRFGHVTAVADVDLEARSGQVLALVGDNGAGKSTLMSVLIGLARPTQGRILVDGVQRHFSSPKEAVAAGISAVTQDLALVECLDVATNMFIGQVPSRFGFVRRRAMEEQARAFLDGVRATVPDVRAPIGLLSGGQRQMVAIARAVRSGAPVVVMDEPTAALGVAETAQVMDLVRSLSAGGTAVVLVSHDMGLVFDVADRIQVMRRGTSAGVLATASTTRSEVVSLITGATRLAGACG